MTEVTQKIVYVSVSDLKAHPDNPRKVDERQMDILCDSIKANKDYFETRPILCNPQMVIFAGNMRFLAAKRIGMTEVPCSIMNIPEERQREIMIRDNRSNGQWDFDLLANNFDVKELMGWGFEEKELLGGGFDTSGTSDKEIVDQARAKLIEKFIIPPFSVLDTRQGYWQDRKQMWIDLGIKSDLGGREKLKTSGSFSGTIPGYYDKKKAKEKELGHGLENKEFEEKYLPDMIKDSNLAFTDTGGILSIFDPVLTEVSYRWFIPKEGMTIVDPFAGGSVRGIVAGQLGYKYKGVDLSEEQIIENRKQAVDVLGDKEKPQWVIGNSLQIDEHLKGTKADLIFSCPPYYDLEVYSEDPNDLSNMEWSKFQTEYREIIRKTCDMLNESRFAIFVVGEVREKGNGGAYRSFVQETIKAFTDAGLKYYNDIILLNTVGSGAMRVAKQFNSTRKVVKIHQNVLVFYKGNIEAVKSDFPDLDFTGVEEHNTFKIQKEEKASLDL